MGGLVDLLRRREKAEEDIYFQRRDRTLIENLRRAAARQTPALSAGTPGLSGRWKRRGGA